MSPTPATAEDWPDPPRPSALPTPVTRATAPRGGSGLSSCCSLLWSPSALRRGHLWAQSATANAPPRVATPGAWELPASGQHLSWQDAVTPEEGPPGEPLVLLDSPAGRWSRPRPPRWPTSAKGTAAVTSPPPPGLPHSHDLGRTGWAGAPYASPGQTGGGEPLPGERIARLAGAVPPPAPAPALLEFGLHCVTHSNHSWKSQPSIPSMIPL